MSTQLLSPLRLWFVTAAMVLAGCTSFQPTKDDQLRSWQEIDRTTISGPLHFPEFDGFTAEQVDARKFLFLVSVGVLASEKGAVFDHLEQMIAAVSASRVLGVKSDEEPSAAPSLESHPGAAPIAAYKGSGVAITEDGYIVTAGHVAQDSEILVLYFEIAGRRVMPRTTRARVVFVDLDADFALVKCEIPTPRCLRIRPDPVAKGEAMFSGGWWNERGAGRLLETRTFRSARGLPYRRLRSSIPMLHGDSGSAVIDAEGRLVGVTVRSLWGRFWRQAPKSDAVMLDRLELQQIIEQDRQKQHPSPESLTPQNTDLSTAGRAMLRPSDCLTGTECACWISLL